MAGRSAAKAPFHRARLRARRAAAAADHGRGHPNRGGDAPGRRPRRLRRRGPDRRTARRPGGAGRARTARHPADRRRAASGRVPDQRRRVADRGGHRRRAGEIAGCAPRRISPDAGQVTLLSGTYRIPEAARALLRAALLDHQIRGRPAYGLFFHRDGGLLRPRPWATASPAPPRSPTSRRRSRPLRRGAAIPAQSNPSPPRSSTPAPGSTAPGLPRNHDLAY